MKKVIFILLTLLSILITSCSQTNESKAKKVIKEYFKETLDDYDSYSPMNYSELNMTETKWKLPKELEPELVKLTKVVKRINQQFGYTIEITSDVDYYIEKISLRKYGLLFLDIILAVSILDDRTDKEHIFIIS